MKQLLRSVGAAAVLACALTMGVRAVELVLPEATAGEPYHYELPAVEDAKTFTDADQISSWAREPISYAQSRGLINGVSGGAFAPKNNATRAENSAVFQRMILAILSKAK